MAKKHMGYGDFFCTNCGERIEKGARNCPGCGAPYSGTHHYDHILDVDAKRTAHHSSILRYRVRTFFGILLFCALEALGIGLILYFDGHFDSTIYGIVLLIIYSFQMLWMIPHVFGGFGRARKLKAANRANIAGPHHCLMCPNKCDARDNFCGRCGCIILK